MLECVVLVLDRKQPIKINVFGSNYKLWLSDLSKACGMNGIYFIFIFWTEYVIIIITFLSRINITHSCINCTVYHNYHLITYIVLIYHITYKFFHFRSDRLTILFVKLYAFSLFIYGDPDKGMTLFFASPLIIFLWFSIIDRTAY